MIAVLTDPTVGGIFLTWSIYYLSGKEHYFSARNQCITELPNNPLGDKNAHRFMPNASDSIDDFDRHVPLIIDKDECFYFHLHHFKNNTQYAVTTLTNSAKKTIVMPLSKEQVLYVCKYSSRANFVQSWNSDRQLYDADEIYNDFVKYFFKESYENWQKNNLTQLWDKREFIALNFNPFSYNSILEYIAPEHQRYHINPVDLWTTFDSSVHSLFDYLETKIDTDRYQKWLPVYRQWQNLHKDRLMFVWYFNTIVDSIIQGINFDLTRFNLDIVQEAAIQHVLIYKHNLNFKTWQLDQFKNTKQLHNLLEPNIHDLSKSNIKRLTT